MSDCCNCNCGDKTRLLYSCSGAADVGLLSDRVARKLTKNKWGKMTCLAAIGAELSGFIESAKAVNENIVIDGCPVACGKKQLDKLKLPYKSYIITDLGLKKGKTEVNNTIINEIVGKITKEN